MIFAYWVNLWEAATAGRCVASAPKGQAVCGKGEEGCAISSPTSCRWHGISKWLEGGWRGSQLILAPQVLSWCCQSVIFFCSSSVICLPRNSIRLFLFVWRYWIVNRLSHPSNLFRFTKSALFRYLTADSLRMIEYFYFGFISAETLTCYTFDSFSLLISSHLDRFSLSSSFLKEVSFVYLLLYHNILKKSSANKFVSFSWFNTILRSKI